jgi:hypothetical protein
MKRDNDTFTVSPDVLHTIKNTLYTIYVNGTYSEKRFFGTSIKKWIRKPNSNLAVYFKSSNNLKAIECFCQSMNTPTQRSPAQLVMKKEDTFLALIPRDLQLKILEYCNDPDNLYHFRKNSSEFCFKGFLNENSENALKHITFHFKNFDIQLVKREKFRLKIISKKNLDLDPDTIVQTLKENKLIPESDNVNYWKQQFDSLNKKNPQNCVIPFQKWQECLLFPFAVTPLFSQELYHYISRHNCSLINEYTISQTNFIFFNEFIKSIHYFINNNTAEKIVFVETVNTPYQEEATGLEDPFENCNATKHSIKIFKLFMNNDNKETAEEIQNITLPRMPTNRIRYNIATIFRGILVLYDKQNKKYPCFALLDNKYLLDENVQPTTTNQAAAAIKKYYIKPF